VIEHGTHGLATYQRRFGSWSEALKEAGFDPNADQVSDEELLDDLQRLHEELGKVPSILDVEAEGNHGPTTYQNRSGVVRSARGSRLRSGTRADRRRVACRAPPAA